MRLRSTLGRGAVLCCVLAALPTQAALAATPAPTTAATVVTTTPSQWIGGLPASTLDGKTEYIPQGTRTAGTLTRSAVTPSDANPSTGYDISWPECGGAMPPSSSVAVVGVDDGHLFSQNPCFDQELAWASTASEQGLYMVVDSPIGWTSPHVLQYAYHGPAGDCTATEYACLSFNWGYNAATYAVQWAQSQGANTSQWWLDTELPTSTSINPPGANCYAPNFWVCDPVYNYLVVQAAASVLRANGKTVGVYSTKSQWGSITGGLPFAGPIWIAGYDYPAATYCDPDNASAYWFALSEPRLVQSLPATFDPDTDC
ncbi:MAG TPA: hypothetical protein VFN97_17525 [Actinospica sp.]|nr:hypothetical protein [Actinospica sp.]